VTLRGAAIGKRDYNLLHAMAVRRQDLVVIAVLAAAAAAALAVGISRARRSVDQPAASPTAQVDPLTFAAAPHLLLRNTGIDAQYNRLGVAPLDAPNDRRGTTALECERVAFAGGHGVCLQAHRGVLTTFGAKLFDARFQPYVSLPLDGSPSRTRVSPDGRTGAITVFVTGQEHGYAAVGFSTKTTLIDMTSGAVLGELEQFTTLRNGARFSAPDFNFWGVTFAADGQTFYATLMSDKKTYLVRGDIAKRTMTTLHENVECPALSPDGRRIAYKKRVGGGLSPWRLYVLDLDAMAERPIEAESRSIDDQLEWLDNDHVLYGVRRSSQSAIVDVWLAPVAADGQARVFALAAESPIVVK
jgi:WD40 repeat protein